MDWRLNSSAAVPASELRAHLEAEAAAFIRATCPPVEMSGGLSAPAFVESKASAQLRSEMAVAISVACSLADSVSLPDAKFVASLYDVTSAEGGRRLTVSVDQAMPALAEDPVVDVTSGGSSSLQVG